MPESDKRATETLIYYDTINELELADIEVTKEIEEAIMNINYDLVFIIGESANGNIPEKAIPELRNVKEEYKITQSMISASESVFVDFLPKLKEYNKYEDLVPRKEHFEERLKKLFDEFLDN